MHTIKTAFDNGRGQKLSAIIDRPVDDLPIAYAIFAHCFTCSKTYKAVRHISRALAAEGFAVLSFDFTGLGDSEGEFAETSFSSNVDDIVAAADFLADEPWCALCAHRPLSRWGRGHDGRVKDPSATAVVTIAAPASLDHLSVILEPAKAEIERAGLGGD